MQHQQIDVRCVFPSYYFVTHNGCLERLLGHICRVVMQTYTADTVMHTQHSHCSIDIVSTLCHHCITTDHCRCMLLLSHVTMMDQSQSVGAAAGVSYCSRALPLHCLVSSLHHTGATLQGESSRQLSSRTSLQHYTGLCTHCRLCPVCAHTAALQHDPALQPCPGCCEETAHALTMHCRALLLVRAAGRHGTLLPLQ